MSKDNTAVVECQMMIRRPISEVFEAFINPAITTNFWFTHSSGPLIKGAKVTWTWQMYNASGDVWVKEIVDNKLIIIDWGHPTTTVEFAFTSLSTMETYVVITNYGYSQTGADLIATVKDNTGGFTTVLDGCKAYLEHGINLNLIADKHPHISQK